MSSKAIVIIIVAALIVVTADKICLGDDFDDGIPIDEKVSDTMKGPDRNIKFIIKNAKRKANRNSSKDEIGSNSNSGAVNSVIMGPGSDVSGDIIIIDDSKGDTTVVVD